MAQSQTTGRKFAQLTLPAMGNTAESDRLMLREISDTHVYDSSNKRSPGHSPDSQTLQGTNAERTGRRLSAGAWQFVQQSRRLNIPDNDIIRSYQTQYAQEALWISRILSRATPYIGHIVKELDKRYLPVELALLPAIESGFQPDVVSAREAAGIWQIVPDTASEIGIKRTVWFDGRADIIESTEAALDYLSYLNAEFHGDWLLTLAAYNAGPGRVRNAVRVNKGQNKPTDFWSLKLPKETRNYVPKFLALVDMLRNSNEPALIIPSVTRIDGFSVVDLGRRASIDKLAARTNLDEKALTMLNSALVHGVSPPEGPHRFYFRTHDVDTLRNALMRDGMENLYTLPAIHTVVAGDTISSIAKRYGLSQSRLRAMNALEGSKILIGQQIAVRQSSAPDGETIEYVVTIGDTLSDIANRFSVQLDDIRDADGEPLASDLIHPGVLLSILVGASSAS